MTLHLCCSCRHSYPASGLAKAAFTDKVGEHIDTMHALLAQMTEGPAKCTEASSHASHLRQQMEVVLQDLCASMHAEAAALRRQATVAEEQRASRERDLEAANSAIAALTTSQEGAGTSANLVVSCNTRVGRTAAGANAASANSRQAPLPTFNGSVPSYQQKKMVAAFDLVSASIYSVLESLAIEVRADTALLWIRPRGVVAVELVAPFVVGRDLSALRASAPYRVPETSMPAAVSTTGTAVNVKPAVGVKDTRAGKEINLHELMDSCNVAQLLVPVFNRYIASACSSGAGSNGGEPVIGVVHLIGSPRCPFPFGRRNEEAAMHAATFLSSIMSTHYQVMSGEWGNHFYQPDILQSTSTFQGRLDLRADEKAIDDFTPDPMLIYRCDKDLNAPTDPRESSTALRTAMARAAAPSQHPVLSRVRDLHRHAATMEANWMSAVDSTTRLEHRIGAIEEETIKNDVQQLREARAAATHSADGGRRLGKEPACHRVSFHETSGTAAEAAAHAATAASGSPTETVRFPAIAVKPRSESLGSMEGNVPLTAAVPMTQGAKGGKSEPALKQEEVDHLESVALRRLEHLGVDTSAFRSPKPPNYVNEY